MKIDESYWNRFDPSRAVNIGLNHLRLIPQMLYDAYPEIRPYKVGVFDDDDIALRHASGWVFLMKEHFPEVDDFNKIFPARFRLRSDETGKVRYRNQYIMIIPKKVYEKITEARLEEEDRRFQAQVKPEGEVPTPHGTVDGDFEYEEAKQEITAEEPKRGPGRPKKIAVSVGGF